MVVTIFLDVRMSPAPIGTRGVLARDQARVQKLLSRHPSKLWPADTLLPGRVTDPGVMYFIRGKFGDSPATYMFLVDTESDKFWIDGNKGYIPSSSSTTSRETAAIEYEGSEYTGVEYSEQLTLGDCIFKDTQFVVVSVAEDFAVADGVIGIDPHDVTKMTCKPNVLERTFSEGGLCVRYIPASEPQCIARAEFNVGEPDLSRLTGAITYTPFVLSLATPYSNYDQMSTRQNVRYGDITVVQFGVGMFYTMNTLLLLATEHFNTYRQITGALVDKKTGLLTITAEQFKDMKNLVFEIGSATYELTPDAQVWPRALNSSLGGELNKIYLVVADSGSTGGFDIICGYSFMRHFYTIFDTKNHQIGLATTEFTDDATSD